MGGWSGGSESEILYAKPAQDGHRTGACAELTMSISLAPCRTASSVSTILLLVLLAPNGKPITAIGRTLLSFKAATAVGIIELFTHTVAVPNWRASAQTRSTSAGVLEGASSVWSINAASSSALRGCATSSAGRDADASLAISECTSELRSDMVVVEGRECWSLSGSALLVLEWLSRDRSSNAPINAS